MTPVCPAIVQTTSGCAERAIMDQATLDSLMQRQRAHFASGATLPVDARLQALETLEQALATHEQALLDALHTDLGKSQMEAFICEIGLVKSEIDWMRTHLKRLCRPRHARTPLVQFAATSYQSPSPYGTVLIMSPWNYPVLLTLEPLVDALAAGNTAVIKPSAYAPASADAIRRLLEDCFDSSYVAVVTGGRAENQALLKQQFDKIFFTGSPTVGKLVMESAAQHLTPVTLELGGKSPCIVEKSAKIKLAARRIVFGKFVNCGQTCVAPDYVLCDASVHDALVTALKREIVAQFGERPLDNPNYGRIVNEKHFDRLLGLIDGGRIVHGGAFNRSELRIEPTIIDQANWDDAIMQEEIFGPLLPVLTYENLDEALELIEAKPRPLALYCFTKNRQVKRQVLARCRFGGGCINDTLIHLATSEMPFGGVGESGMGSYHGKAGFEEFTHERSIVDKKTWIDLPIRYQPYKAVHEKLARWFI
ncbi:MAG: aldehyde dehydrogenase [Coriobacteriales bacterium]|nr:aldehyde dehydrogenase [Coriobacteriales bacterium]